MYIRSVFIYTINMLTNKPEHLKGIPELLKFMKLDKFQKLKNFHILKFEDHPEQLGAEFHATTGNFFEISISCNWNLIIDIDGEGFTSKNNHLSFIPPGRTVYIDKHKVDGQNRGFLIFYTPDFLRFAPSFYSMIKRFPYYNIHHSPVYGLDNNSYAFYNDYMEKIYQEFQIMNKDSVEIIRAYLTLILFETKKLLIQNVLNDTKQSRAEEITYQFEQLLKKTAQKNQKLSFYATKLNISTVYLSECIKKVTNTSAKQLLTDYIIYESKYLLSESENKLDIIASQLGFNETSNFINFFKKNTEKTPNQFRKHLINNEL